jgi:hypothetical protein
MEKNDLLGVRTKPVTKPVSVKRRRKAAAGGGGGGGRRFAKAITDYLASDSYMYAPLVSDPQRQQQPPTTPPPAAAPAAASPGELSIPRHDLLTELESGYYFQRLIQVLAWRIFFICCVPAS